ncbi:hypothetical protein DFJ73DRAFT_38242 [Zopfochytrium polystomum]|nr:hypothetical protein DFJ73DRAFT_38242 [Zopfochytrium polystomum]
MSLLPTPTTTTTTAATARRIRPSSPDSALTASSNIPAEASGSLRSPPPAPIQQQQQSPPHRPRPSEDDLDLDVYDDDDEGASSSSFLVPPSSSSPRDLSSPPASHSSPSSASPSGAVKSYPPVDVSCFGRSFQVPDPRFFFQRQWLPLWGLGVVSLIVVVALYLNRNKILPPLMAFCASVRAMGATGHLILTALVFISSFPFMIGYGTLLVMSGFIFGFPLGFIPAYLGAVLGAFACLFIFRRWMGKYYRDLILGYYPKFKAVESAIDSGGMKLVVLIRLAPYPYGFMNLLLATTTMPASRYMIATAIGEVKNLFHVYIGSTLRSLADIKGDSFLEIVLVVCGLVVAAAGFAYLTWLVRRALKEADISEGDEDDAGAGAGTATGAAGGGGGLVALTVVDGARGLARGASEGGGVVQDGGASRSAVPMRSTGGKRGSVHFDANAGDVRRANKPSVEGGAHYSRVRNDDGEGR